jgi:hypothetical protein
MKLVANKEIGKYHGAWTYTVVDDNGNEVGCLEREYNKSAGRWRAQYVGHWEGYYEWDLLLYEVGNETDPDYKDEESHHFDSFKEAKSFIENRNR